MADARVRTNRFILKWGWVQPNQGSFRWGPADRFIGRLAISGIRTVPAVWGNPDWLPGSGSTPPIGGPAAENAWRNLLRALVARYGPGGSLLDHRLPAAIRRGRQAAADPVLADLERAQPEEVLRAERLARKVRASWCRSPTTRSKEQNPQARVVLAGVSGNGDMRAWNFLNERLRRARDQEQVRRRRPSPVLADPRPTADRDREGSHGDEEPRRRGDAAVAHRARLGLGGARRLRPQQGPRGSSADAHRLLQHDPEKPQALERGTPVLVPLARSPRRCGIVQLLRQRCPVELQPHPEARLRQVQELRGRDGRGPRRRSPEGQVSPGTQRRPSPSPRTSPAPPSSARSTGAPTSHAARRIRPRRLPTATMPCSSGRSMPPATTASSSGEASRSTPSPPRAPGSPTATPTRRPTTTRPS